MQHNSSYFLVLPCTTPPRFNWSSNMIIWKLDQENFTWWSNITFLKAKPHTILNSSSINIMVSQLYWLFSMEFIWAQMMMYNLNGLVKLQPQRILKKIHDIVVGIEEWKRIRSLRQQASQMNRCFIFYVKTLCYKGAMFAHNQSKAGRKK